MWITGGLLGKFFLYVDDSAFILPTREDTTKTENLTRNHLKRFGLQMHTGTPNKKSKTEVLFIPHQNDINNNTDVSPIILSNGTQIIFTTQFTSTLSDDIDINPRICKTNQVFGCLRSLIFCNPFIPLKLSDIFVLP